MFVFLDLARQVGEAKKGGKRDSSYTSFKLPASRYRATAEKVEYVTPTGSHLLRFPLPSSRCVVHGCSMVSWMPYVGVYTQIFTNARPFASSVSAALENVRSATAGKPGKDQAVSGR